MNYVAQGNEREGIFVLLEVQVEISADVGQKNILDS